MIIYNTYIIHDIATYRISQWFKSTIEKENSTEGIALMSEDFINQLFNMTNSLLSIHKQFKLELESRMVSWENSSHSPEEHNEDSMKQDIDDIMQSQVQRIKVDNPMFSESTS